MFDHIGLGVSDYAASKQFFLAALQPLGAGIVMEGEHGLGIGPKGKPSLWMFETNDGRAIAPGLHGRQPSASARVLSRGHRCRRQGQRGTWHTRAIPSQLLRRLRDWARWPQRRSRLPSGRGLMTNYAVRFRRSVARSTDSLY
jgi:catechol 2,3-dioxygenase-like lactoylglutathione lyase family enzyme